MAKSIQATVKNESVIKQEKMQPTCLEISAHGIKTGRDYANFMSALMSDIISGRVTPQVGNAACNAGGKLLKVVEMQYRYGSGTADPQNRILKLAE